MMCKGDNSTGRSFCRCDVTYVVKDNGECGQYIHVFLMFFLPLTVAVLLLMYCCCSIIVAVVLLRYYCYCSIIVSVVFS